MLTQKPLNKVLEVVNSIRKGLDGAPIASLPKGIRDSSSQCVLARAFNDIFPECSVANREIDEYTGEIDSPAQMIGGKEDTIYTLPNVLADFIDEFDAGIYPELIADD